MKEIIVNVDNYNENSIKTIEGDNLSEVYKIYICKNKRRIDLTNKIAIMAYVNEYGNKKSNILALNITNASQGEIELPITNVISSENGVYACQVAIYGENNSLEQTAPFSLIVENNIFSKISNVAINSTDFQILSEAIKTTNAYCEKLKEGTENIELQYANKLNKINLRLDNTYDKQEVDGKIFHMINMGQDVKEAMTGGSVAVVGENAVGTINIQPESVTDEKINKEGIKKIAKSVIEPIHIKNSFLSDELLNKESVTNGFYMASHGVPIELEGCSYSAYIEIKPNAMYEGYFGDMGNGVLSTCGCYYNEEKTLIDIVTPPQTPNGIITTPLEAKYLILNLSNNKKDFWTLKEIVNYKKSQKINWLEVDENNLSDDLIKKINKNNNESIKKSKWYGKKANFLGDSITAGYGLKEGEKCYVDCLKDMIGFSTVRNYGSSGTKIAYSEIEPREYFAKRYIYMDNDADIIFVLGGTNDYGHSSLSKTDTAPFGVFSDRTDKTFYGALHVLYQGLLRKYIGKQIVVITPLPMIALIGKEGDYLQTNPDTNKNLLDYCNAIKEVAGYYSIPVIDMLHEFGINPIINELKESFVPDGIHPNAKGAKILAEKIASKLECL
ncbi:SGNH/GDSL hydrolase family protein [Clostridium perfringens]|uniref:SGNH/GDSL hydrolase family protein n=1 Tax=Clostridium perfringens TaxID=1502 RepID=UPI0013D3D39E|nr:SGNH/GDSL hydrolase family protein [Clostridium perfringens]